MSKSEGNVVDPIEQLEKYGLDAVRYYSLAGLNTTDNSAWDEDKLIAQFNAEICNDWGNLVSRVLHLVDIKLNGNVSNPTNEFKETVDNLEKEAKTFWEEFKIKEALQKTNEIVKYANKYANDETPWNSDNFEESLNNLYYLLGVVSNLYS